MVSTYMCIEIDTACISLIISILTLALITIRHYSTGNTVLVCPTCDKKAYIIPTLISIETKITSTIEISVAFTIETSLFRIEGLIRFFVIF